MSNSILFVSKIMLTCPTMTFSEFFSLSNFREFVSLSNLLLSRTAVVEIDSQYFVFKTSELLGNSVSTKFDSVPV